MTMTKTQVLALLKENRNERGIANWKKLGTKTGKLKSFGIGLTQLRKLAKQIGRDHKLAWELWKSENYDVKVIGLLIDDPKQLSRTQAEEQVEELHGGMFPHIFMHWLTARRAESFRLPIVAYPLCVAIVWIPSVLLGVVGSTDIPGLQGAQANSVLIRLIHSHAPEFLAGLLVAGVFAAIMSSLDSQTLSLGTMFTQDIVRQYGFRDRMSERQQILVGRWFVVGILLITYVPALSTTLPRWFG